MRLVVTGGSGQLGRALAGLHGRGGLEVIALGHTGCDITDERAVARVLAEHSPDALVNAAAYTRVDDAEDHPDAAFAINATGPRVLAEACTAAGVRLVHVSTDYVFDGTARSPIPESAATAPRSVYGASKLAGEQAVAATSPRHLVVRTAWLYGADGPNFVLTMLRLAAKGVTPRVVADQTGAPTWTGHLAPALVTLVQREVDGIVHLTNSGTTTWHGLATAIYAAVGAAEMPVAISTEEYPVRAQRPRYSVLDNRRWRDLGEPPLPDWREGLTAYLSELDAAGRLPAPA